MACQRRTICSAKFVTGLLCGVIMGFLMGTIHLALMNSRFAYLADVDNPCPKDWAALQRRNGEIYSDSFPERRLHRRSQNIQKDTVEVGAPVDNVYDYNDIDAGDENGKIEKLLGDSDIDKIYEVDLSKLDQLGKSERGIFQEMNSPQKPIESPDAWQADPVEEEPNPDLKFLYVGVMTAAKYVPTRGKAIMDTWGPKVPGKVELFVGESAEIADFEDEKALNVVRLKKVDDNMYPPQKKSFMMLKYMYDQYINGYEWFMRADDDAYIKTDKLENLLRNLNSSEPLFIGQTGLGNEEERGKLTLDHGENYCMGGPGMIFSREVIRRIAPNIGKCLRNMYTNHEDVEVSRCISKYANVHCVWSYEMRELFYEHYSKRLGYIDPYEEYANNGIMGAITLHPNKKPEYQRVLHNYFLSQKIKALQAKVTKLHRDVVGLDAILDSTPGLEEFLLGSPLSLNRYRPDNASNIAQWHFFMERLYLPSRDQPRRGIPSYTHAAVMDMVMQVMRMMNRNAKSRGRVISFKRVNYGYIRVNPLFGSEYIVDMLLHYNRYRGKKVSLPVRRHAYLQQTFARTVLHEDDNLWNLVLKRIPESNNGILDVLIHKPANAIASFFGYRPNRPQKRDIINYIQASMNNGKLDSRFTSRSNFTTIHPTVHLIVPLTGRFTTFQRFMTNIEGVALSRRDPISLLIMLFVPKNANERNDMKKTQELLEDYKLRYPSYDIRFLPVAGEFSRGLALEIGASQFSEDSLLFFCDVDVLFNSEFLRKCRSNTVKGKSVYYPVLFSEFDPNDGTHGHGEIAGSERGDHFEIVRDTGYWRGFGYGLLCVYQSDFASTGGFDTSIKGWGLEDVDLFGKFVKRETEEDSENPETSVTTAIPMRVHEPDLIHVYHPSHCDPELESKQLTMCLASRSSSMMSVSKLYQKWRETKGDAAVIFDRDRPFEHQNENFRDRKNIFYGQAGNGRL